MTAASRSWWALRRMRLRGVWLIVLPFFYFARPTPWALAAGGGLVALGLAVRGWAAGVLDKGAGLTTAGPYALTRNPLYLGSLAVGLGTSLAGGHWLWPAVFLVFFVTVYLPTIRREAEMLTAAYPEQYGAYAASVPLLVPRIRRHRQLDGGAPGFTWAGYRRNREWEAGLGAIAAFAVLAWKVFAA